MALHDEAREAMANEAAKRGLSNTAAAIRAEDWTRRASYTRGLAIARAGLEVIDEYEEVEVQEASGNPHYLRTPDTCYWNPQIPSFIILRRKQKPDVEELARRVSGAWHNQPITTPEMCDAMAALDVALEEVGER